MKQDNKFFPLNTYNGEVGGYAIWYYDDIRPKLAQHSDYSAQDLRFNTLLALGARKEARLLHYWLRNYMPYFKICQYKWECHNYMPYYIVGLQCQDHPEASYYISRLDLSVIKYRSKPDYVFDDTIFAEEVLI